MNDQSSLPNKKTGLSNLSAGNRMVIISGFLFIVSLFFAWTQSSYGMVITTMGYSYIEFDISMSGWPNLIPFSLLAALTSILLCIPFLKPTDKDRKKKLLKFVDLQIILSVVGLHGVLILSLFQIPALNGRFLFGGWLGTISMIGLVYGSVRTRSDLL
jgi:glucan phosphoethanolaminetransferase (alkaline phosphatase superfamily)